MIDVVRERNLLNKINNLATVEKENIPKPLEFNHQADHSVVLCKPQEKRIENNLKLDFSFDVSENSDSDDEDGCIGLKDLANKFLEKAQTQQKQHLPVLDKEIPNKNRVEGFEISNIQPPSSPGDRMKEMCLLLSQKNSQKSPEIPLITTHEQEEFIPKKEERIVATKMKGKLKGGFDMMKFCKEKYEAKKLTEPEPSAENKKIVLVKKMPIKMPKQDLMRDMVRNCAAKMKKN